MPNIGPMELIVVLVIALVVLGPKKLPEVGRSIGRGVREFKESIGGRIDDDDTVAVRELEALHQPAAEHAALHTADAA
jgi:sec-independent protein translocase protein TatA